MAILTDYSSRPGPALLLVADDDTVLSATRLAQLLSCYRGEELLFLGEQILLNSKLPKLQNWKVLIPLFKLTEWD